MRTDHLVRELNAEFGPEYFRSRSGLPATTYFSGPKLRWLLDNVPGLRDRAEAGEVLFGTIDSWLIWRLTGRHLTDVTNASRTLMMSLETLDWDDELLAALERAARDAARDPLLGRGLRRGPRHARRGPGRRRRWAISRRRCSGRRASRPARPNARTAPAASC